MEYIFSLKNGSRVMIGDEGNNIVVNYIYGNRVVRAGVLYRNYRLGLCCKPKGEEIYISYISVENELVWDKLGSDTSIILYGDKSEKWSIDNISIQEFDDNAVIFYKVYNQSEGISEIKYVVPELERQNKILCSMVGQIDKYEITQIEKNYYIWYKLAEEANSNIFIMNMEKINDINISECFIYDTSFEEREIEFRRELEERFIKELEKVKSDFREEEKNFRHSFKKEKEEMEEKYEKDIEIRLHNAEQLYKKQYDELAELTKEIQEEGKKWRELYYKSVKKK